MRIFFIVLLNIYYERLVILISFFRRRPFSYGFGTSLLVVVGLIAFALAAAAGFLLSATFTAVGLLVYCFTELNSGVFALIGVLLCAALAGILSVGA